MHPDDVAEHVTDSVWALTEQLRAHPELGASDPIMRDGTDLYIGFVKQDRAFMQVQLASSLLGPGGHQTAQLLQVPDLGAPRVRRELILLMNLDDFDGQPPTAQLLLPDRSPLPAQQWPKELANQGIVHGHPDFDRPYFCRRGLREYHEHSQHEDDPWDRHREGLSLHAIVTELLADLRDRWIGR
jgi:hypothetical protein